MNRFTVSFIVFIGALLVLVFLLQWRPPFIKKSSSDLNTFYVALGSAPRTLDPRRATSANGMRIVDLLFQSLVYLDKNLKLQSEVASSWTYQNQTYTFIVPKNQFFSNGRKMTKEDILFSFQEYIRDKQNPFSSAFQVIEYVKAQEESHQIVLKVKLKQDSAKFLRADLPVLKILPKKEILENPDLFRKQPIGTGAFKLISSNSNQIVLKARKDISHPPKIDQVFFKIIRDDLTRTYKMLNQELDLAQSEIPFHKVDQFLNKKKKFSVISNAGVSTTYLLINFKDPCLADKKLRKALALSLDRKQIIEHKLHNKAKPAVSILNPLDFYFNRELKNHVVDLEKSRSLLKQISSACKEKKLVLTTSQSRSAIEHGKILALQFRKVGLPIKLKSFEWGTFYADLNAGRFQLALLKWTGIVDPDIYRVAFHSSEWPPKGRNRGYYSNSKLDELLERGSVTMNKAERQLIYNKVQKIAQEDLAFIPLWHEEQITVATSRVLNYYLSRSGDFRYLFQTTKKQPVMRESTNE